MRPFYFALGLVLLSTQAAPAYACSYSRVNAALPIIVTFLPVLLLGFVAYRLRRRTSTTAKIIRRVILLLTVLAFAFFISITWANTLGWESPCEGWAEDAIQPLHEEH